MWPGTGHVPTIQELRKCSGDTAVAAAPMPEFAQEGEIVMRDEDEVQPVTVYGGRSHETG
jgi:hypothetical protein